MTLIQYIVIGFILIVVEMFYLFIAKHFNIGCDVTPRSSHKQFNITGGGIIFYVAILLFILFNCQKLPESFYFMIAGATILALVSFYDDLRNISPIIRLIVQFVVVTITFYEIFINGYYDVFLLILICGVGFINAFNFMDGINGILSAYTVVVLGSIYYGFENSTGCDAMKSFIVVMLISTIVFGCFNFRKKAICFAGDVGAIVMGYIIMCLIVSLILYTSDASVIVFLIVYAVDTVYTIFQRLFAGENIFLPHRHHLYQTLANQWQMPHYLVSAIYAVTQLVINIGYYAIADNYKWTYTILVTIVLSIIYFAIKRAPKSQKS